MNQFSKARTNLNEAEEIVESGGMKLYLCDLHLEAGRLCTAEGNKDQAEHHFSRAREIIEETGYFRRSAEAKKLRD